jgi:hypothetical protein
MLALYVLVALIVGMFIMGVLVVGYLLLRELRSLTDTIHLLGEFQAAIKSVAGSRDIKSTLQTAVALHQIGVQVVNEVAALRASVDSFVRMALSADALTQYNQTLEHVDGSGRMPKQTVPPEPGPAIGTVSDELTEEAGAYIDER